MADIAQLYEPLNEYKPFGTDIGVVDGPFEWVSWAVWKNPLPFTTRMTVIQFASGDLFLHSPTKLDGALATQLRAMGRVRHLVSPNKFHYAHIEEWARAFPDAITWASPRVRDRIRQQGANVHFQKDLTAEAPEEWRSELEQTIIPGRVFDEVAFFHKKSRTLVLADTIMNFELDKLRQPYRTIVKWSGAYAPSGQMPIDMRLVAFWPKRRQVGRVARQILTWQPEKIILSHGRCFEANGTEEFRRAFGWALKGVPSARDG